MTTLFTDSCISCPYMCMVRKVVRAVQSYTYTLKKISIFLRECVCVCTLPYKSAHISIHSSIDLYSTYGQVYTPVRLFACRKVKNGRVELLLSRRKMFNNILIKLNSSRAQVVEEMLWFTLLYGGFRYFVQCFFDTVQVKNICSLNGYHEIWMT